MEKNGKWGFLDENGTLIPPDESVFAEIFASSYMLSLVEQNNKWGVIDATGKLIIPCEWDACYFGDDLVCVKKDEKYGVIDATGKIIVPCECDSIGSEYYLSRYEDNKLAENGLVKVRMGGKYGCFDTSGNLIIPCEWDDADPFCESFVGVKKEHKTGVIDTNGNLVIPCEYDSIGFGDGYFTLIQDGCLTILDKDLNVVF